MLLTSIIAKLGKKIKLVSALCLMNSVSHSWFNSRLVTGLVYLRVIALVAYSAFHVGPYTYNFWQHFWIDTGFVNDVFSLTLGKYFHFIT